MFFFRCFFTCLFFLLNIYLQLEYVHRTENYDKDERHARPPHHNEGHHYRDRETHGVGDMLVQLEFSMRWFRRLEVGQRASRLTFCGCAGTG